MAAGAAPTLIRPQRGSVVPLRPRKHDRRTAVEELEMELVAAGQEMTAAGRRIEYAILSDRSDIALHVAARLQVLGAGYANPDPEGSAA